MADAKGSSGTDRDMCAMHKQWNELSCPVCMEHPHNAVLLLCSSHEKGCRSYICDTSYRHSNCLDRFRKMKVIETNHSQSTPLNDQERSEQASSSSLAVQSLHGRQRTRRNIMDSNDVYNVVESNGGITSMSQVTLGESSDQAAARSSDSQVQDPIDIDLHGSCNATESGGILNCPLCRGAVFGWKIIKEAREYLDLKSRSCSHESCSFTGNYRELRRHARRVHPTSRPADVEPSRERAWRRLERQTNYGDILSAIRSAIPGAILFGDYAIDNADGRLADSESMGSDDDSGPWWTTLFLFHMFSNPLNSLNEPRGSLRAWRSHRHSSGRRYLWGENLLGLQVDDNDNAENEEDPEDEDIPVPRRRRRITRPRLDEELP